MITLRNDFKNYYKEINFECGLGLCSSFPGLIHVKKTNIKRMEECKWNYKIIWHYVRLTESDRFIILGKREGQWRSLVNFKVFRIMVTWRDKNNEYHYKPLGKYLAYKINWL